MRILVIEDEPRTANSIKQVLEDHKFAVDLAFDGQIGQRLALREQYDLIISDIILPYINGLELCKSIREHGIETPVLMLTALGTADDKVSGLDSGADDYLVKPFEFKELLARVRALLRRTMTTTSHTNILRFADIEMNLESKEVTRANKKIDLTPKEFALMEYLIRNHEKVVSKKEIAEKVWEINFDTGTNVIEVYVNYLRKKIDRDFPVKLIHTQFGMGYILKEGE
jgi:two-component system copper resistance phosphate regulon response regulator CusR